MVKINNVKNSYTKEVGNLKIIARKYEEGLIETHGTNMGLLIFFNDIYIKSFILTENEVNNIVNHNQDVVQDLGFILSIDSTFINIIDIASYATTNTENMTDNGGIVDKYASWWFELTKPLNEDKARTHLVEYGHWGMQLAIITALKNPISDTFLVNRELPDDEYVEFDYGKEGVK